MVWLIGDREVGGDIVLVLTTSVVGPSSSSSPVNHATSWVRSAGCADGAHLG
jgi:hypothetical protein